MNIKDTVKCVKCHNEFCCMPNLLIHRKECWALQNNSKVKD